MKIGISYKNIDFNSKTIKTLKEFGDVVMADSARNTEEDLVGILSDVEVLIIGMSAFENVSSGIIDQLRSLKYISVLGSGYNFVDTEYARTKGIIVSNIKGANAQSVAEHVWGMILGLTKNIAVDDRELRSGEKERKLGIELFGKTLGIIGTGEIGKRVAKIASGFSMQVLGTNQSGSIVEGIEIVSLSEVAKSSDVIAIAAPLSQSTRGMIDEKVISLMKEGVVIVNCGREEIVMHDAIISALKSGKVKGYGIDLDNNISDEHLNHFKQLWNVVMTPHSASSTVQANLNEELFTIENISSYFSGKPIRVVN